MSGSHHRYRLLWRLFHAARSQVSMRFTSVEELNANHVDVLKSYVPLSAIVSRLTFASFAIAQRSGRPTDLFIMELAEPLDIVSGT